MILVMRLGETEEETPPHGLVCLHFTLPLYVRQTTLCMM